MISKYSRALKAGNETIHVSEIKLVFSCLK